MPNETRCIESIDPIAAGCTIAADALGDVRRDLYRAQEAGDAALLGQLPLNRVRLEAVRETLVSLLDEVDRLGTELSFRLTAGCAGGRRQ